MRSLFVINLVGALLYIVTAMLSVHLTVPPQTASAVWPPAGFAVGMALIYGYRSLPGTFLGALIFNANNFINGLGMQEISVGLLSGTVFATGVSAQAAAGAFLARRFVGEDSILSSARDIVLFLFLTGPVSCVISPILGNFTFLVSGTLPAETFVSNLITFWTGDVLGVLLVAPLAQVLRTGGARSVRFRRIVRVMIPMVLCVALTLALFKASGEDYRLGVEHDFQRLAGAAATKFDDNIERNIASLEALRAFFESSEKVTPEEFQRFAERLLNQRLGVRALSWNPIVRGSEVDEYRELLRSESPGLDPKLRTLRSDGSLHALKPGDRHMIVHHVFPHAGNETVVGVDLLSEHRRRAAIELALRDDAAKATQRLTLVQDDEGHAGVIMFAPVRDVRTGEFVATVSLVIDLDYLLEQVIEPSERKQMGIILVDSFGDGEFEELTSLGALTDAAEINGMAPHGVVVGDNCPFFERRQVRATNHNWSLYFLASSEFMSHHGPWQAEAMLMVGTFLVALLGAFLLMLTGQHTIVQEQVDERTRSLRETNVQLEEQVVERQRAEQRAIAAREEAERANSAKTRFLANMSHEIRTPMTAILGFSEMLADAKLPAPHDQEASTIHRASEALLGILNSILDFSKVESGRMELHARPTDLRELLEECAQLFRAVAVAKRLEYAWRLDRDVPTSVRVDGLRLRQIVNNLLGNAVKFTRTGSVWMQVGVATPDEYGDVEALEDGVVLRVIIRDTGPGIPDGFRDRIFEPFRRATESTEIHDEESGTGLGLAISAQISRLMGGRIEVNSTPGKGTECRLYVPVEIVADEAEEAAHDSDDTREQSGGGIGLAPEFAARLRVLIGEDNALSARVAEAMLAKLGIVDVDWAQDGQEAVTMAAAKPYDVILLDGWMPKLNGAKAAREIRRMEAAGELGGGDSNTSRGVRIVAFSANAREEDRALFEQAGAEAFLAKPIRLQELRDSLAELFSDDPDASRESQPSQPQSDDAT